MLLYPGKNITKHGRRESPRIGVVATAVIGVQQQETIVNPVLCRVSKFEFHLAQSQCLDNRTMSDPAKRQYDGSFFKGSQFVGKKPIARIDFCTDRLVIWRQALHRIGNPASNQLQAIISPG
jgi:hypothetical protein